MKATFLAQLEPIYFWEPFNWDAPWPPIGLRGITQHIRKVRNRSKNLPKVVYPKLEKEILLSANTVNQREALRPLIAHFAQRMEIITERPELFSEFEGQLTIHSLPTAEQIEALALNSSRDLLLGFFSLRGYVRDKFLRRFYNTFKPLGQYHFLRLLLGSGFQPKLYLASNDHSGLSQIGFLVTKELGIPSLYIQHASVSEKFPPLMTTYALLEGRDAQEKYASAGTSSTMVRLIGTMKYDAYLALAEAPLEDERIGVAVGVALVNYDEVFKLCEALDASAKPFTIRFHPAVSDQIKALFSTKNWLLSAGDRESAMDFILKCSTIISGDSNILLEALVLCRRPIYFASTGKNIDYYNFVKNGLVGTPCYKCEDVMTAIGQHYDISTHRKNAAHYIAFLETPDANHASERAIKEVAAILDASNEILQD